MSIHHTQHHSDRKVTNTATQGSDYGNSIAKEQNDLDMAMQLDLEEKAAGTTSPNINALSNSPHLHDGGDEDLRKAAEAKVIDQRAEQKRLQDKREKEAADQKRLDSDRFTLLMHQVILNEQYYAGQAAMYRAQAEAVDKAMQNVMAGKAPTDGMTPEEKQNFEDAVQEYKDKYGLTDVDLTDSNVLRQIGALAKENEVNAQANEAEAKAHRHNITEAPTEELRQAAIQSASEADFFVALKTATELDDDLNASEQIFKLRGYDELSTAETSAAHSNSDSFFSDSDAFDDLDMTENVADTNHSTSVAATYDEKPLFDQEPISAKFQTAALGATDESPTPEQENTLATNGQTAKPIEFNQFPA